MVCHRLSYSSNDKLSSFDIRLPRYSFLLLVLLPFDRSGGVRGDLLYGHAALRPGVDPHHRSWGCLWEGTGLRLGSPVWLHSRHHWSDGGLHHRLLSTVGR